VQAGHDETKAPTKRSTLQQTFDSDPQLTMALLVVQSKMIRAGQTLQLPQDPNTIVIGTVMENKDFKLAKPVTAVSTKTGYRQIWIAKGKLN
jgi:hypothetical protein